ncbi:hypothetical protein TrVFT333_002216 [Trichoderma virens FT-333]|nr:hypothetical protein TrVFT333_002216 [Trichoderma virens FT-333]
MTDTGAPPGLNKTTIAAAANQCLESFQKCLFRESSIHPKEFSMVEDQVARFSTWTSGIGVFAPGRASMDHRLRYAPEVQSVTIGLLESLNHRIRKLWEVLDRHDKGPEAHISNVFGEGMGQYLGYIAVEISHLIKTSNIIRKASQETHTVRAKDFHIKDEEGNDVEVLLLDHYRRYIGDRFPTASVTIQKRLADSMILRRKLVLYKRSRYGKTAIQPQKSEPEILSISLPDSHLQLEDNQKAKEPSRIQSATTLHPEKFNVIASSPSVVSATKTVALGNHEALNFPTAPGLHAKRKYEQFKAGQLATNQVMLSKSNELSPAIDSTLDHNIAMRDRQERISAEKQLSNVLKPEMPAIGEITCPYCLCTLPVEEVFNKQKWQNHVKNDLDPYVCLFEQCNQPDELYKHSEKWLDHMHQHGQRWHCSSHRDIGLFSTCEEYMQHMRKVHETKLSDAKLRVLANRNARSLPQLFASCPLCGNDESEIGGRLTDHITGHLRSLAIRSLPCCYDDMPDDVENEDDSSNNSQARGRSTVDLLDDEGITEFLSTGDEDMDDLGPDPSQHTTTASERIPSAARPPDSPILIESTKQQAEEVLRVSQAMQSTAIDSTNNDGEGIEDKLLKGADISQSQIEGKQREQLASLHAAAAQGTLTSLDPYKASPHFSIDELDGKGRTALAYAALRGHVDVVKLLISEGANANSINDKNRTVLWYASHSHSSVTKQQRREVIEHLLHNGADPNVEAKDGTTPLMELIQHRDPIAIKLITRASAEISSPELRDHESSGKMSIQVKDEAGPKPASPEPERTPRKNLSILAKIADKMFSPKSRIDHSALQRRDSRPGTNAIPGKDHVNPEQPAEEHVSVLQDGLARDIREIGSREEPSWAHTAESKKSEDEKPQLTWTHSQSPSKSGVNGTAEPGHVPYKATPVPVPAMPIFQQQDIFMALQNNNRPLRTRGINTWNCVRASAIPHSLTKKLMAYSAGVVLRV